VLIQPFGEYEAGVRSSRGLLSIAKKNARASSLPNGSSFLSFR
jgi:hypothetical protein